MTRNFRRQQRQQSAPTVVQVSALFSVACSSKIEEEAMGILVQGPQPPTGTGTAIDAGATVSLQSQSLKRSLDRWVVQVFPWPCTSDLRRHFARDKSKLIREIPREEGGDQNSRKPIFAG